MGIDDRAAMPVTSNAPGDDRPDANMSGSPDGRWYTDKECLLFIAGDDRPVDRTVMPLHDAVLLDEHEDLLCCIDVWLARAHDWHPLEATGVMPAPELTLFTQADPLRRVSLVLPANVISDSLNQTAADVALSERLPLPREWQSIMSVQYHQHSTRLVLDRVTLGKGDLERLASGALVVLPASFDQTWRVMLEASDKTPGAVLHAVLDASSGRLEVPPDLPALSSWLRVGTGIEGATVEGTHSTLLVTLSEPVSVNLRTCEDTWRTGISLSLPPLSPVSRLPVSLRIPGAIQSDEQARDCVRLGSLLRIGQGLGVIIDGEFSRPDDQ